MTTAAPATEFIKLQQPPEGPYGRLLPLNNHEFVVVPQTNGLTISYKNGDGIYKYNAINKDWQKIMDYPKDFKSFEHFSTIDIANKIIYVYNANGELFKIDLNTKSIHLLATYYLDSFPGIIFANNTIHVIAGATTDQHLIYDTTDGTFEPIKDFDDDKLSIATSALYFKKNKSIITTIHDPQNDEKPVSIMEFKDNQWNIWKIPNCEYLYQSKIVGTTKGDYVIFMAGLDIATWEPYKYISVYDVRRDRVIISDIEAPSYSAAALSTIVSNDEYDNLLTFGFMNESYQEKQIMPIYIIELIEKWVCVETWH